MVCQKKMIAQNRKKTSQGLWTGALGHRVGVGFCSSLGLLILPCHRNLSSPQQSSQSGKAREANRQKKVFPRPPGFCVPRSNAPHWPWRAPALTYTYTPTHIHVHILKNSKNKSLKRRKGKQLKLKDLNIHFCKDGLLVKA